jgi:hypothetical protein
MNLTSAKKIFEIKNLDFDQNVMGGLIITVTYKNGKKEKFISSGY